MKRDVQLLAHTVIQLLTLVYNGISCNLVSSSAETPPFVEQYSAQSLVADVISSLPAIAAQPLISVATLREALGSVHRQGPGFGGVQPKEVLYLLEQLDTHVPAQVSCVKIENLVRGYSPAEAGVTMVSSRSRKTNRYHGSLFAELPSFGFILGEYIWWLSFLCR